MPIVAGPGAIAVAITFAHDYPGWSNLAAGALLALIVGFATAVIFWFAPYLLLAICVQSILTGLTVAFLVLAGQGDR